MPAARALAMATLVGVVATEPTSVRDGLVQLSQRWPWLQHHKYERDVYYLGGREPISDLEFVVTATHVPGCDMLFTWRLYTAVLKWDVTDADDFEARYVFVRTNERLFVTQEGANFKSVSDTIATCLFPDSIRDAVMYVRHNIGNVETGDVISVGPQSWLFAFEYANGRYTVAIAYPDEQDAHFRYLTYTRARAVEGDDRPYDVRDAAAKVRAYLPIWRLDLYNGPRICEQQSEDVKFQIMARIHLLQRQFVSSDSSAELAAINEGYAYEERLDPDRPYIMLGHEYADDDDDDDGMDVDEAGAPSANLGRADYCDKHRRVAKRRMDEDDVVDGADVVMMDS